MILVDSSVWIDHLHAAEPELVALLDQDGVATHPWIIEELALGSLRNRSSLLNDLESLTQAPALSHDEAMALVTVRRLWARGLSVVDAHLLGAVLVSGGAMRLWTRDRRLREAATELGLAYDAA